MYKGHEHGRMYTVHKKELRETQTDRLRINGKKGMMMMMMDDGKFRDQQAVLYILGSDGRLSLAGTRTDRQIHNDTHRYLDFFTADNG